MPIAKVYLKQIASQVDILESIKANIDSAQEALANVTERLQEHYDGRSEQWQESDAGEEMREVLGNLEEAVDSLREYRVEDAFDALGNIEQP